MSAMRPLPTSGTRSLGAALVMVGAFAVLLGVFELAVLAPAGIEDWPLVMLPVVFWIYVCAGLIAWRLRPGNGTGLLIIVAGLMLFVSGLANTGVPTLVALTALGDSLALPALAHLLLAFPSGRLPDRLSRMLVVALYAITVVLGIPGWLFARDGRFPPFAIADLPVLVEVTGGLQTFLGMGIMVMVAAVLVNRLRTAEPRHRRVLAWLFSYGIFAVLGLPLLALVLDRLVGLEPTLRGQVQFVVTAGIPVFFALGVVRGGFARTGELDELSAWLASAGAGRDYLGAALARALGDPTLRLLFAAADGDGFVDADGTPAEPTDPRRNRQTVVLEGRIIGAIDYDAALLPDPELVRQAGQVIAIAADRERLTAELLASQRAVRESRERLVEAADQERRRIARDLHDGLQARMVLLALEAQRIAGTPPDQVRARSTQLRRDIDAAAAELRAFVHDLVPAALIERGLPDAAADLADRMPIPTTLDVRIDRRPGQSVESTAYLVLAESLTNAVRHSDASAVSVGLHRDDDVLRLTVADDGRGGAARSDGMGMRGMRDRVETLGGSLRVDSAPGLGTTVTMEVPCAS